MSENIEKNNVSAAEEKTPAVAPKTSAPPAPSTPEENVEKWARGTMILKSPIKEGKDTVTEVHWDFLALTGTEYVNALDGAGNTANTFLISNTQALHLFAAAAGKATDRIDATDILQRMGAQDAQMGTQVAMLFSKASFLAGSKRISRG